MTDIAKKSILARLLARENITVEQTNHHTAFFDVERRILGIPHWKDVSKDLFDLFVGHEIGHALHTPAEGWHSSTTDIPGCPRGYVNVVEDIRIEKLVLREFPGLLGGFMRGYQELLDRDFFGIKNEDVNKLSFVNRLNIHTKSRGLVDVKFSAKEQPYVDRAMATETWEDVIASCREIYEFMQEELEAQRKLEEMLRDKDNKGGRTGVPDKIILKASKKGNAKPEPLSEETKEAILNGEVEIEVDLESFDNPEEDETEKDIEEDVSSVGNSDDIDQVETDLLFRAAITHALVDSVAAGGNTLFVKGPNKAQAEASTSTYEQVVAGRHMKVNSTLFPEKAYLRFQAKTKDSVNVMVKEFEMRKTARRFARARQSMKGSLDVNALHKYKYDDAIFKQVTHFDDDQSHGMVMMIDYSGSMESILPKVLKQLLILVSFCKRVNVPFEVYGFTNPGFYSNRKGAEQDFTSVSTVNTHVFKLIDSSMPKKVYEEAYKVLFAQSHSSSSRKSWFGNREHLQGTPLENSIMVMYHHIAAFRAKHNIQKMNFITLTDGQGEGVSVKNGIDAPSNASHKQRVIDMMGRKIKIGGYRESAENILNGLREMGVKTMNFHIVPASSIKYMMTRKENFEEEVANFKKEGVYVIDNQNGYDRQIFTSLDRRVKAADDVATEDEDEITDAFIADVFNKKRDRLIAAKFAQTLS